MQQVDGLVRLQILQTLPSCTKSCAGLLVVRWPCCGPFWAYLYRVLQAPSYMPARAASPLSRGVRVRIFVVPSMDRPSTSPKKCCRAYRTSSAPYNIINSINSIHNHSTYRSVVLIALRVVRTLHTHKMPRRNVATSVKESVRSPTVPLFVSVVPWSAFLSVYSYSCGNLSLVIHSQSRYYSINSRTTACTLVSVRTTTTTMILLYGSIKILLFVLGTVLYYCCVPLVLYVQWLDDR